MSGISGIILLGGGSRRMGRDKALLTLGGETLAQRTTRTLAQVADEVVLVRGRGAAPYTVSCGCPVIDVVDPVADGGPMIGLLAGLDAASEEIALVVAVDLPFLQPRLLRLLATRLEAGRASGAQWVVPVADDRLQPLCSAFAVEARAAIRARADAGDRALIALEPHLVTTRLDDREWRDADPEGLSFVDIDTPEAYAAALERYERLRAVPETGDGDGYSAR